MLLECYNFVRRQFIFHTFLTSCAIVCLMSAQGEMAAVEERLKGNVGDVSRYGTCRMEGRSYGHTACTWVYSYKPRFGTHTENDRITEFMGDKMMYQCSASSLMDNKGFKDNFVDEGAAGLKISYAPIISKNEALFGWLHVRITVNQRKYLHYLYAQGEWSSQRAAPSGSFVYLTLRDSSSSCRQRPTNYVTKRNILPCHFAQDPFPSTPYAFGACVSQHDAPQEVHLNYRIDFPFCGAILGKQFYLRAFATKDPFLVGVAAGASGIVQHPSYPRQQAIKLKNSVHGAPDPAPPENAALDCTKSVSGNSPPWVDSVQEGFYSMPEPYDVCLDHNCFDKYTYQGRCSPFKDSKYLGNNLPWTVSPKYKHNCRVSGGNDPYNKYEDIQNYWTVVLKLTKGDKKDCPENIACMNSTTGNVVTTGISTSQVIGPFIWACRRSHAVVMMIACLFVYPVNTFIARYYKETFLWGRYVVNIHLWYSVHIYFSFVLMILLGIGVGIAIFGRRFLGYGLNPYSHAHVGCGYFACVIAIFGLVTNAVRIRQNLARQVTIFIHFAVGLLFYGFSWYSLLNSTFIPASPSSDPEQDMGPYPKKLNYSEFFVICVLWLVFDILMHVILSILIRIDDNAMRRVHRKPRTWALGFFVPLPLVTAQDRRDYKGTRMRRILLFLYFFVAAAFTIGSVLWISLKEYQERYTGPMECTTGGKFIRSYCSKQ